MGGICLHKAFRGILSRLPAAMSLFRSGPFANVTEIMAGRWCNRGIKVELKQFVFRCSVLMLVISKLTLVIFTESVAHRFRCLSIRAVDHVPALNTVRESRIHYIFLC